MIPGDHILHDTAFGPHVATTTRTVEQWRSRTVEQWGEVLVWGDECGNSRNKDICEENFHPFRGRVGADVAVSDCRHGRERPIQTRYVVGVRAQSVRVWMRPPMDEGRRFRGRGTECGATPAHCYVIPCTCTINTRTAPHTTNTAP